MNFYYEILMSWNLIFSSDPDRNLNHSDAINEILLISDKDMHTQMVGGTHENGNGTDLNGKNHLSCYDSSLLSIQYTLWKH